MIFPANFETKIEFHSIRKILKSLCLSTLGQEKVDLMSLNSDFETINNLLCQTDEFKDIIVTGKDFPVSYYINTYEYLDRTEVPGSFLATEELLDIKRSLDTIHLILVFFKNDENNKYPKLKELIQDVDFSPIIVDTINNILDKYGNIKDNASPELRDIRKDLRSKNSGVSNIVSRILQKSKQAGLVESDAEAVIRGGKMLIPISSSNKRKIKGYVFDESDTGKTSYIEPLEVIELNNEIKELEFAEKREIIRILIEVSNIIRPHFPEMRICYDFLANIDFIRAKALFAVNTDAEKPQLTEKQEIDFRAAAHPLLYLAYKSSSKKVVRSDINIEPEKNIILISGPNAGGKSVSLKTCCLLQYMVQCGLLITTYKNSITGIFNNFFIDIGDEQSIENDLSTYSSHLKNMKYFSENANEKTLIFIDEFGTGTEPQLGGAIAEAFLEVFVKKNAKGIITTHYTNLKNFASNTKGISNAAMLYDIENLKPLYRLEIGNPGSSFAFEIAKNTGIAEDILQSAEKKIDKNYIRLEQLLKENEKDKRLLRQKKRSTKTLEQKLQLTIQEYENTLKRVLSEKKQIIEESKQKADETYILANKKIEETIRLIKIENAQKEKTTKVRQELEEFIKKEEIRQKLDQEKLEAKIKKIKERQEKRNQEERTPEETKEIIKQIPTEGDIVKMNGQRTAGKLTKIQGKYATVEFAGLSMKVGFETLEKVSKAEEIKYRKESAGGVKIISDTPTSNGGFLFGLDVRGKRADEALTTVIRYIDDATVAGAGEVKILHGTGTGALKQLIRDYLNSMPNVLSVRDEHIEMGGSGISVVLLKN